MGCGIAVSTTPSVEVKGFGGAYVERNVERSNQANDVEAETDVASDNAELSLEWQFIQSVPLDLPAVTETDVGKANAGPHEEVRQTREGKQPGEDGGTGMGLVDESQETEANLDDDTPEWTAFLVNVHEELGTHTPDGKSLHCSGGGESAGVGHTDDGDGDDSVEDGGKTLDVCRFDGQDERGSFGVGA